MNNIKFQTLDENQLTYSNKSDIIEPPYEEKSKINFNLKFFLLIVYVSLRTLPLFIYLFKNVFFKDNVTIYMTLIVILNFLDFWSIKNIFSRKLIGLRWWNNLVFQNQNEFKNEWIYEVSDSEKYDQSPFFNVFWTLILIIPLIWLILTFFTFVDLQIFNFLLVSFSLLVSLTNTLTLIKSNKKKKSKNSKLKDYLAFMESLYDKLLLLSFFENIYQCEFVIDSN